MRILTTLSLLLASFIPVLGATTWPAGTNTANQTFFGTNTFLKPVTIAVGTRTFTHDGNHTMITNTATLTASEWTAGSQFEWYNGAKTITIDKTNGALTALSLTANSSGTNAPLVINTNALYVSTNGKVGIGTTNPTDKLVVKGSGDTAVDIDNGSVGGQSILRFQDNSTNQWYIGINSLVGGNVLEFRDVNATGGSGDRMVIDQAGKVGIGTVSPANKLSVSEDIGAMTITLTNNPTFMTTNVAPAGYVLGVSLPVVWFAITNAGNKYLIPGFAP